MENIKEKLKEKFIESLFGENDLDLTENQIRQEAERISRECGENVEDIFAEISAKKEEKKNKRNKKMLEKLLDERNM